MEKQLELFKIEPEEDEEISHTMYAGIYHSKGDPDEYYDGKYLIAWGGRSFCAIFEGIQHIEEIVEHSPVSLMQKVDGYCLAINKLKKKWYIRNSSIKHQPGYVLASGNYKDGFPESLFKYLKVLHK